MTIRSLRTISIGYLMLPNFFFYSGWTTICIAIAGIVLLAYLFYDEISTPVSTTEGSLRVIDFVTILLVALLLTIASGINGYCYQTLDYWAHNAKFKELYTYSWPVRLPDHDSAVISYYYGFYIIPSLFNKMAGQVLESVVFAWTFLGLALGIGWVYLSVNRKIVFVWLILCLGDLPRVINAVMSVFSVKLYNLNEFGIESWSNMENLFWVPNQVIPSLMLGGMFMYTLLRRKDISAMVLPIALSFWWAAFPALVCGLLVAILVIREWILVRFNISLVMATKKVLLPFATCVPVLILFLSHEKIPVSGFLWDFDSNLADTVKEYLTNIIVNIAMFIGLYMLVKRRNEAPAQSVLFYTIILLSLTFPLYRMGEVNDFLIRGMMPVLVIIGIYLLEPFSRIETKQMLSYTKSSVSFMGIFFLLGCSTLSGTGRLWRAARVNRLADPTFIPISYDAYPNVYEALKGKWSQEGADQYMGDPHSFYENYIAP